jgi:hypothetical protein
MKECFLILAVLESWLLVFCVAALFGGRFDLCFALGQWLVILGCAAWLAYRHIAPRARRRQWTGERV